MKRFLLLLAFVLAFSGLANATQRTATFGDKNSSGVYRMRADTDSTGVSGAGSPGWITFAADTGIKYPYQTRTAAGTTIQLLTGDSGAYITDFGGITPSATAAASTGSGNTYLLPPCTLGLQYDLNTGVKDTITVKTASGDGMLYTVSGTQVTGTTGVSNNSTKQAGDEISFVCTAANAWSVANKSGTWQ